MEDERTTNGSRQMRH